MSRYLLQPDEALLVAPQRMIRKARAFMASARKRGLVSDRDLELRGREIAAAKIFLNTASDQLRGVREFIEARDAFRAVLSGDTDVLEKYTRRLGLPHSFPEKKKRIQGDPWLFHVALATALYERKWIKPPGCTHINRYLRNRARQMLWDRKKEDEKEHIDAQSNGVKILNHDELHRSCNELRLSYDEQRGWAPPRIATIDFRLDFHKTLDAINADKKFRRIMTALLFDDQRWADLDKGKHYSTSFRNRHRTALRQFRARMVSYLEPPARRIFEEQLEAEARNRAAYLQHLAERH